MPVSGLRLRVGAGLVVICWLIVVGTGFAALLQYKATPGEANQTTSEPSHFPESVSLQRHADRPTLLMFAHPCCPCTTASLRELTAILAECPQLQPATVIFTLPPRAPDEWSNAPIVELARQTRGIQVLMDDEAQLTTKFGVQTSGHVLFYDAAGTKQFSGGITALRGHEGWSAGRGAIVALCRNLPCERQTTPVFGCSLLAPAARRGGTP